MSEPLKVGDLVEIVRLSAKGNRGNGHLIGRQAVITEELTGFYDGDRSRPYHGFHTTIDHEVKMAPNAICCWPPEYLKRIPPKSDFEKAEDWFIEYLMKTLKSRERA